MGRVPVSSSHLGRAAVAAMVVTGMHMSEPGKVERSVATTNGVERSQRSYFPLPMRVTLVPQVGQTPWMAGRPFLSVVGLGSFISTIMRSLTQ